MPWSRAAEDTASQRAGHASGSGRALAHILRAPPPAIPHDPSVPHAAPSALAKKHIIMRLLITRAPLFSIKSPFHTTTPTLNLHHRLRLRPLSTTPAAMSKAKILLLGEIDHAHKTWAALGEHFDLIEPQAKNRADFLAECKAGKLDGVVSAYRTFASLSITGRWDAELVDALPASFKLIAHNGPPNPSPISLYTATDSAPLHKQAPATTPSTQTP